VKAPPADLARRVVAELLATALLLATVVGSGIMAERLAAGEIRTRVERLLETEGWRRPSLVP
jgi:glycerol uptake facilitator-like aquaporin